MVESIYPGTEADLIPVENPDVELQTNRTPQSQAALRRRLRKAELPVQKQALPEHTAITEKQHTARLP